MHVFVSFLSLLLLLLTFTLKFNKKSRKKKFGHIKTQRLQRVAKRLQSHPVDVESSLFFSPRAPCLAHSTDLKPHPHGRTHKNKSRHRNRIRPVKKNFFCTSLENKEREIKSMSFLQTHIQRRHSFLRLPLSPTVNLRVIERGKATRSDTPTVMSPIVGFAHKCTHAHECKSAAQKKSSIGKKDGTPHNDLATNLLLSCVSTRHRPRRRRPPPPHPNRPRRCRRRRPPPRRQSARACRPTSSESTGRSTDHR